MNQLYHPQHTADFFAFLAQHCIPTYTVTNNAVGDLTTYSDSDRKVRSLAGIESFLSANGLDRNWLTRFAFAYYESRYNPPRKPFDFYVALALSTKLRDDLSGVASGLRQVMWWVVARQGGSFLQSRVGRGSHLQQFVL